MVNIPTHAFETLIEAAQSYLPSQKYAFITSNNYSRIWQQLLDYAKNINADFITDNTLNSFVNATYGISEYLHPKTGNERRISRPLYSVLK